ncbi:hypothetical protein, partial [Odoribacter laneus]|uniref:hypothetical protein n=1 Tax=Odoribacter laneus TaxID=626933 RepID=UPI001E442342
RKSQSIFPQKNTYLQKVNVLINISILKFFIFHPTVSRPASLLGGDNRPFRKILRTTSSLFFNSIEDQKVGN